MNLLIAIGKATSVVLLMMGVFILLTTVPLLGAGAIIGALVVVLTMAFYEGDGSDPPST